MLNESPKNSLETELTLITSELETIAVQNQETGDWVAIPDAGSVGNADKNVGADAVEEWDARRALMSSLEIRYRNIVRALKKVTAGSYGICELSGEPIEEKRLEANPAARTNIANMNREEELPA